MSENKCLKLICFYIEPKYHYAEDELSYLS